MAKATKDRDLADSKPTDRTWVTLPAFVLFELKELEGIYGPTTPEVIKWIVQAWLHENQAQIDQRKKRHRDYLAARKTRARP